MSAAATTTSPRPRPHDGYVVALGLGLALLASLLLHASLLISALRGGATRGGGEAGHEGAGDMTVDISVAAPTAPEVHPALAPPPAAEPAAPAEPATPAVTPPHPHPTTPPPVPPPPTEHGEEPAPEAPPPPDPHAAAAPAPEVPPLGATGTGADVTSGGRSPGMPNDTLRSLLLGLAGEAPMGVEAQRALLPVATTCEDPVAGVWRAFKYSPFQNDWVRFTLVIHHAENGTLQGTITSRIWGGGPSDRSPPPCEPDLTVGGDYTTRMPAHGHVDANLHVSFGSTTSETVAVHCPALMHDYAPDNFSGTIDPTRQEFQSVNNDGAMEVNSPYVFRRTGCVDE